MFFEKVEFMMLEMERLLADIEKLKKLNKILVDEVVECRKGKKFGVVGSDEYRFLIDMVVKNEMEFEDRLWGFRKLGQLRGSFEHECFFYFLFIDFAFINSIFLIQFIESHTPMLDATVSSQK
jgi:hypothetical protein